MGRGGGGGSSHSSSHHSSSHSHSAGSSSRHASSSSYSYRSGSSNHSGGSGSSGGCLGVVFFSFIFVFVGIFYAMGGEESIFTLERSTIQREPLPATKCEVIDEWYRDDWGDWIDEPGEEAELELGLKTFYENTGVQPYLWITGEDIGSQYEDGGNIDELAEETYKAMFGDDEGHVLIIFKEYPNASSNYVCTVLPGYDAETQVLDEQAREIMLDYVDYYYTNDDLNEGEFFREAFVKSSERMMTKQLTWKQIGVIVVVAIIAVIGLIITASIVKKRKVAVAQQKAKQARAEADKKMTELNTQKYNDAIEKEFVAVTCPNCGSTANKIRKGTVNYCDFCGTAIKVDNKGAVEVSSKE